MRILLTGGSGLLGRAILRQAAIHAPDWAIAAPSSVELDATDRLAVAEWLAARPVDAVIHAAARVGGIAANIADPRGFLTENLRMNDAVITGADEAGVGRLLFLGSSCIYPRDWRQPLLEEDLLAGPLESSNEAYALAKIAGLRLCSYVSMRPRRAYRTLVPCNLFGIDDHFGSHAAHLVAAAIGKVTAALHAGRDEVTIWGTGRARREFLDADHLARFILDVLPRLEDLPPWLNVGADQDHTVDDWYRMVAEAAGYGGRFVHDVTRPEGMRAKLMSSARARDFGYRPPESPLPALSAAVTACEARQ